MPRRLSNVRLREVSLVTRPANSRARILFAKGMAVCQDCGTEYQANLDACPDCGSKVTKGEPLADDVHVPVIMSRQSRKKRLRSTGAKGDNEMPQIDKSALDPEVVEYITKLEDTVIALQAEEEESVSKGGDGEGTVEDLLKTADPALVEYVNDIKKSAEQAEAIAKAERDARIEREILSKAESLPHLGADDEVVTVLKAAQSMDDEGRAALESILTKANAQVESSAIFSELGKSSAEVRKGEEAIDKAAEALRASDSSLTKEQAIAKALDNNPSLYNDYLMEG